MPIRFKATVLLAAIVLAAGLNAQSPTVQHGRGPLPTTDELLQRHGIALTTEALQEALKNRDPEIRLLAAARLADYKVAEAIPVLLDALASEDAPRVRMGIAFALARLGDTVGRDSLQEVCLDASLPDGLRIVAARYLFHLTSASAGCRASLVSLIESSKSYAAVNGALALLLGEPRLSPEEKARVAQAMIEALRSGEAAVRMMASKALRDIGDRTAVPLLLRAISDEQDDSVRSVLEADLQKLAANQERPD